MSPAPANDSTLRSGRLTDVDEQAPSGRGFIALLEAFRATGGTAPSEILARLFEEPRVGNPVGLAHLIDSGQVFGFEWRAKLWIPMFQFDPDALGLRAEVQEVRAELPASCSGWSLACWFAGANAGLDGRRPVDTLGSDPEAVLRAARSLLAADGLALARGRRGPGFGASV